MEFHISPRRTTDRGGIVCMVRADSLKMMGKQPREGWTEVRCPTCGSVCYTDRSIDALLKADSSLEARCTACALKAGSSH